MYQWLPQQCPICEVPPRRFIGRRGGGAHRQQFGVECQIWSCEKCGLIFPNPMPVPINGLAQHYAVPPEEFFEHHDTEQKKLYATEMLRQAAELIGGKGALLDIGAGRGELLTVAVQEGWKAVGIEPSPTFADYAERHSGAEIRREFIERCGFPDRSFDVVILGAVLEHLYNPDETIREASRVLRQGGALFVDVPNEAGLYFKLGNLYQRLKGRDWVVNLAPTFTPYHVFGFSPAALKALLKKHHLKPERWRIYGGESWVPAGEGLLGRLEQQAAKAVTQISNWGTFGTYIETWARKEHLN